MMVPDVPHPYRALQLTTGTLHTCALLENHQIKCWGQNDYGQLGLGDKNWRGSDASSMGDALPFVQLGTGRSAKAVAAGRYSTCAVLDNDTVKCWGWRVLLDSSSLVSQSSIGDEPGEMGDALQPIPLGPGRTVKSVALADGNACVAQDDSSFLCGTYGGGRNFYAPLTSSPLLSLAGGGGLYGLFADGSAWSVPAGPGHIVASGAVSVASGYGVVCVVLLGGRAHCSSQLQEGVDRFGNVKELSIGAFGGVCAIDPAGMVRCNPTSVEPLSAPAVALPSGALGYHCALLTDGGVECWDGPTPPHAPGTGDASVAGVRRVNLGRTPAAK